jgi:hypothetical protein
MGEAPRGRKNAIMVAVENLDAKILKQTTIIENVMSTHKGEKATVQT